MNSGIVLFQGAFQDILEFLSQKLLSFSKVAYYVFIQRGKIDMDPQKTAVVLIEYQNDFTSDGGTLHDAVKDVMEKENMLPNTVEMVEKARELGATRDNAGV